MGHAGARENNTGNDCGNLETQLDNLAEFGLRDEFIHKIVASGRAMPKASRLSPASFETRPIESSRL